MPQMSERLEFRGVFKALDREGTSYFIDVFQLLHDGSASLAGGVMLYRTPDGQAVKRVREGVYEIEESRIRLRMVAANRQ
jgi:hypothetical protein